MTQLTLFANGASVPAYLRNADQDDITGSLAGGSAAFRRISIKNSTWRMVVNGKEIAQNEDRAMNFIVVAAAPNNSRTFYSKSYVEGEVTKPTCTSVDGVSPDKSIEAPQSKQCATCPQNIAGSGPNGTRACRYSRRLAIVLENDMQGEGEVYQLVVPATSNFGAGENGKLPLQAYAQYLKSNGVQITTVLTEARFDPNASGVKMTFRALRPLTEEEYIFAKEKGKSTEALNAISFDPATLDLSSAAPSEPVQQAAPKPAPRAKPKEEVDIVQFVAEAEAEEPKKRETKKAESVAPKDIEDLIDEWDD